MNKKKVLFYSSVKNKELFFIQRYYLHDIRILEELGFSVILSNNIFDSLCFWKYNIAFLYFYRYSFFSGLIAKILGKNVYFTGGIDDLEREFASPKRYHMQRIFFKLCYLIADKCIIVSSSDLANIKKIYRNKHLRKIVLSFHAIEIENYLCPKSQLAEKNRDFISIAWMGSKYNAIRKGVDLSLELFSLLINKFSYYRTSKFIIIGKKGEGTDYLYEVCKKKNIEDRVIFLGEIEENSKIDLLKDNYIYCQLSHYEGFGIAALEALATGNIVINSGKGGLKDSINKFGILVDIQKELSSQVDRIHNEIITISPDFLKLGEQYVVENFSIDRRKKDFSKIIT